jgi:hypothetical protein
VTAQTQTSPQPIQWQDQLSWFCGADESRDWELASLTSETILMNDFDNDPSEVSVNML